MATRIAIPGLSRRVKTEQIETRDFVDSVNAPGFNMVNAMGGTLNTGKGVEDFTASEIAYRCVDIISTSLASLDLAIETTVTNDEGDEEVELDKANPLSMVFNKASNPTISAVATKRIAFAQAELRGQTFLYTKRQAEDPTSDIQAMCNIFGRVTPLIDNRPQTLDEHLMPVVAGYQVQAMGKTLFLLPHECLWIRYPHPERPWEALAPWKAAMWAASLDKDAKDQQAATFRNGGMPAGVIYLGNITEDQARRAQAGFNANHQGTNNAGKMLFLYGDAKAAYQRMGSLGSETGYIETHGMNQTDMLYAFGVPKDLVIGGATFDNTHGAWISLWTDLLIPKTELFESDIDRQAVPDLAQRAVFDRSQIAALQEDQESKQVQLDARLVNDGITLGEYRKDLGYKPFGDERDDMTLTQYRADFKPVPILMPPSPNAPADGTPALDAAAPDAAPDDTGTPADKQPADKAPAARVEQLSIETRAKAKKGPTQAEVHKVLDKHEYLIQRAVKKLGEKQKRVVLRKLDKVMSRQAKAPETRAKTDDIFDQEYWTDQTYQGLEQVVDGVWTDGASIMADHLGINFNTIDPKVTKAMEGHLTSVSKTITETTGQKIQDQLAAGVDEGESIPKLTDRIKGVFDELIDDGEADTTSGYRAQMIARTETSYGFNRASLVTASESGVVTGKTWLVADGAEENCQALNGTTVGLDESFGEVDQPPLHVSCRCTLLFETTSGDEIDGGDDSGDS